MAIGGTTNIATTPIDKKLAELEDLVKQMLPHLQAVDGAKAEAGLKAVKLEAKASPEEREKNREWYGVSKKGLLEAAEAVVSIVPAIGKGVKETLKLIFSLQSGGGPSGPG